MRKAGRAVPRERRASAPITWGHWVLVALVLGGLAMALLVQREVAAGAALASAGGPPRVALAGPVLSSFAGRPGTIEAQPGTVSLIFDGGPGPDMTSQIASALRVFGVPATFFVPASRVAAASAMISQELAAHDDIGITGFSRADLIELPGWQLAAQIAETQHALQLAGDPGTALVRPPGAATVQGMTAGTWAAARRLQDLGYLVVLADREAERSASPLGILHSLEPAQPAAAGRQGLVLALSDAGQPGAAALAALPPLISNLRSDGYRFTTIEQAFSISIRPTRMSRMTAAGAAALLIAARVGAVVAGALRWSLFAAASWVGARVVFLLITSSWHKLRERPPRRPWHGPVSVIVPAYNERQGIERCLRSMVDSDYPELEWILVDDGSTDGTADLVQALNLPVTIVRQPNEGKATALNAGVRHARHDVLIFADGDTLFEPTTITRLVAPFADPRVGAVAGNVKVANRGSLLGLIQHLEYVVASSVERRMYALLHCMGTVPGAVGAFRKSAITDVGGVPSNTLAEDTDITVAIGCAGWRVTFVAEARAWTEAPSTIRQLWSQRHRWGYGTLQVQWKYRRVLFSPKGRRPLAWIGMPYLFVMTCMLPLIAPMGDLYVLFSVWSSPWRAVGVWAGLAAAQGTLTAFALWFDRERFRHLWIVFFHLVIYRQFIYLVSIHSMATAVTGVRLPWQKLGRIGVEVRQR